MGVLGLPPPFRRNHIPRPVLRVAEAGLVDQPLDQQRGFDW